MTEKNDKWEFYKNPLEGWNWRSIASNEIITVTLTHSYNKQEYIDNILRNGCI